MRGTGSFRKPPSADDDFAPDDADFREPGSAAGKRQGPSLKARAVALLSRREHSRQELFRKLAPHAESQEALEQVLDELARENWQSDKRFAQSLVHRQAARQGASRILSTLRQHGLDAESLSELGDSLRETELDRAREVWQKKFGKAPGDAREHARQIRFLASRGFSPELLRTILREADSDGRGD
ncbi:recombination regulator RecX [Paracandidimonas soli]|uniref:recombination regulator RecX n=1 Tax=Paracandidimonas soli TaxID=1917182 RepID=UPI000B04DDA0